MLNEGQEIKEFTLKKFLGRGGFGEVWLAEKKIEIADKKVSFALKFISVGNDESAEIAKVKREINTWIDASGNKNVLTVLDGFAFENYFVIVSEYADQGSLRDWLKSHGGKSPSIEKTVEIMGGILDGLSHLHSQKIIHRDLKPENVLLKGDVPCIADFGVSRMVETVSLTNSQLGTHSAGSPLYMSPESFERTKPSPQIDIWSAGVMLFEMLSGKTPYYGETIPALIFEIVTKEPRQLPPEIPLSIRKVVTKSLARELEDRFVSAKEMHDALMRALYLKDFSTDELESKTVSTDKSSSAARETISTAVTVPIDQFVADNRAKQSGSKKTLAIAGIGAAAILAVIAGIYALSPFSSVDSKANNSSISNQKIAETSVNQNANAANQKIVVETNAKDVENSAHVNSVTNENQIAPSNTKIIAAETPKKPIVQTQKPTKIEPKRETADKTSKVPKKVTLDDLINKRN